VSGERICNDSFITAVFECRSYIPTMTLVSPNDPRPLLDRRRWLREWALRWRDYSTPRSGSGGSWREATIGALGVWVVTRLLLSAWALFTVSTSPVVKRMPVPQTFFTLFFHWDSAYFEKIAAGGYFSATSPTDLPAFFPGYGIAGRVAADVLFPARNPTVGDITVGLWVAAAVPSLLAGIGLWKLTADRFGPRVAAGATVLLLAGPYSVFLAASYSEPLFLAFAVFAWYHASKGRWWVAGILAAGASLTRIDGLFLALSLGVLYLQSKGTPWRSFVPRALGLMAVAISTLIGYFVYLWAETGNPAEWFSAERQGWHRRFTLPWVSGMTTALKVTDPAVSDAHRIQALLEIVFAILCIVGGVVLARRRRWGGVVLVAATLASLMTSTTFLSLSRESLLLFPLTMLVASMRDVPRRRWIFRLALIGGIVLLLFNTHQFVLGIWAQ
jgi:Mannosyltransferase (PIG-V)